MLNHNKFVGTYDITNSQGKLAQAAPSSIINGPKSWVYNTDEGLEYEIDVNLSGSTCYTHIIGIPTTNASYACKNVPDWMEFDKIGDTNDREDYFGPIVRNEYLYGQYQEEFKWYERSYLLDMILGDTTLLTMGGFDDYLYQQIFDSLQNGSCGQVNGLFQLLTDRQYYFAGQLNDEISNDRIWLSNIQNVTKIYLSTIAQGVMGFDSTQLQILWPIALSIPYEGGPGVYTARVMLGIDPEDYNVPYSSLIDHKIGTIITIYPNPAHENVVVKSAGTIEAGSKFELFSVTGKLVLATNITESCTEINIPLGNLSAGVYFCYLNNRTERSKAQKLIIVR